MILIGCQQNYLTCSFCSSFLPCPVKEKLRLTVRKCVWGETSPTSAYKLSLQYWKCLESPVVDLSLYFSVYSEEYKRLKDTYMQK